jgi:hypothetical protein
VQFKDVAADSTYSFINATGKVSTIASASANAGFSIAHGVAPTSPVNGDIWTTTTGVFARINSTTQTLAPLASPSLTGSPLSTTAPTSDNSTRIATTAFVKSLGYIQINTGAIGGFSRIDGLYNNDFVVNANNDGFGSGPSATFLHTFTNVDGRLILAPNGGGLTFPDATTQTTAGYPNSNPSGYIADAPSDGDYYVRQNGAWVIYPP